MEQKLKLHTEICCLFEQFCSRFRQIYGSENLDHSRKRKPERPVLHKWHCQCSYNQRLFAMIYNKLFNWQKSKAIMVNKEFLQRLVKLLRILVPNIWSKEFLWLALHSTALVVRTFLSIYVADMDGRMVKSVGKITWTSTVRIVGTRGMPNARKTSLNIFLLLIFLLHSHVLTPHTSTNSRNMK